MYEGSILINSDCLAIKKILSFVRMTFFGKERPFEEPEILNYEKILAELLVALLKFFPVFWIVQYGTPGTAGFYADVWWGRLHWASYHVFHSDGTDLKAF